VTTRFALSLGIAGALASAQAAQSALVVRMAVSPLRPLVGYAVRLQVRTYAPLVDRARRCGYRLRAWRVSYPFKVQAVGPNRAIHRVRVRQARGNLYVGRFVPRLPGRWTIRVANFGPSYPACSGSVIRFRVSK
jgi:hypothetical protein